MDKSVHPYIIELQNITKDYGNHKGVFGLSLQILKGEIFGFLGPNGAGKTTAIRLLLDLISPNYGEIRVLGKDHLHHSLEIKKAVGYLPGNLSLYENLTGQEILTYFACLRGNIDWENVITLAERFDLNLNQKIGTLSMGNKQKIGLIQAFMHKPQLLILDEPTNGLDPLMQQEVYFLLRNYRSSGGSVFISSHNLPEVEKVCDRAAIIKDGRIVSVENITELKYSSNKIVEIVFKKPIKPEAFIKVSNISKLTVNDRILTCIVSGDFEPLIKEAAKQGIQDISSRHFSLEDIFLHYYDGGTQDAQ